MDDHRINTCERCFKDERLRGWIKDKGDIGDCDWCESQDVFVVSIDKLGPVFRDVANIYEETGNISDEYIADLFQEDWETFDEKIQEAPNDLMRRMTIALLYAGLRRSRDILYLPDYKSLFRRKQPWLEEEWDSKLETLLKGDKYLPTSNYPYFDLPTALEAAYEDLVTEYGKGYIFYRARIHKDRTKKEKFTLDELCAPPPDKTPAARANRKGEPVLYLSSDKETALAEVRAWKKVAIAIATVKISHQLSIVNLLDFNWPESPFFEENLQWRIQLAGLFQRFAEELSRPVMPHEAETLYLPSQHLCDLFRDSKYAGVAYPSAMGTGHNVVIFNPDNAKPFEIGYVRVEQTDFNFCPLTEHEDIYEEYSSDFLLE